LPAGYTLGELRNEGARTYKLVYNAGNSQISQGLFAAHAIAGAGAYSLTVSSASKTNAHIGAALCYNATATTGTYFWGLVKGVTGGLTGDAASIPTGNMFFIGDNGKVTLMPQSAVTGNVAIGEALTTIEAAAVNGTAYINLP
jgi:hypothetical protein